MAEFNINDRVLLLESALSIPYIHKRSSYTRMRKGMTGRILGYTAARDKVGVEFDDLVFIKHHEQRSTQDNGCHGKGKDHHCWYIPVQCLAHDIVCRGGIKTVNGAEKIHHEISLGTWQPCTLNQSASQRRSALIDWDHPIKPSMNKKILLLIKR